MPVKITLTERHQNILRATIQHYIATAEPVGSKILAEEYALSVSSATIRNVMGCLEKAGLLYQPHTSAGRIPSDSGYRIYVDQLLDPDESIGLKIQEYLRGQLKLEKWSFEAILQRAAKLLSSISGYISLITIPQTANNQLRHLQLVQVAPGQVMLIIVTDAYQTQSVLIDAPSLSWEKEQEREKLAGELQILSNFLNSKLKGRSLTELSTLDWGELDREFKHYGNFLTSLLQKLSHFSQPQTSTPIMVRGVSEVLREPEFTQLEQVQMLLHLLEEEQDQLLPLIFALPEIGQASKKVNIRIGAENNLESMRPCTLISAIYKKGNIPVGSVGVIGPTRMLYENAIALVESAADYLSDALS
ncbi:MAG: heat-inducible transcriptional repressor HrcA [Gomphosphaeria aponina SAG 52.96 = DSM 107014]|uniref:Heat-inducible transcription repressor HrcA n=1 Tax=Gomphosphaeria aponina SAG 52.96 = DSM 107014 TaxID=1521640 RepID=A0A941GTR6_9CHRO|nr:heat-inducible transcriptional repressor HrcA [Gomphosphaeria aponina SAG 52.96 = DSM 107014]